MLQRTRSWNKNRNHIMPPQSTAFAWENNTTCCAMVHGNILNSSRRFLHADGRVEAMECLSVCHQTALIYCLAPTFVGLVAAKKNPTISFPEWAHGWQICNHSEKNHMMRRHCMWLHLPLLVFMRWICALSTNSWKGVWTWGLAGPTSGDYCMTKRRTCHAHMIRF